MFGLKIVKESAFSKALQDEYYAGFESASEIFAQAREEERDAYLFEDAWKDVQALVAPTGRARHRYDDPWSSAPGSLPGEVTVLSLDRQATHDPWGQPLKERSLSMNDWWDLTDPQAF